MTMHSTEFGRCGNNAYGGISKSIRDIEGTLFSSPVLRMAIVCLFRQNCRRSFVGVRCGLPFELCATSLVVFLVLRSTASI